MNEGSFRHAAAVAISFLMVLAGTSAARANEFPNLEQRWGAGATVNVLNFGFGLSADYWFTPKIGANASYDISGPFPALGVRGTYLFENAYPYMQEGVVKPYVSAGYVSVEGESVNGDAKGSGVEVLGGIFGFAPALSPNLGVGASISWTTAKPEAGGIEPDSYSALTMGFKIIYYFGESASAAQARPVAKKGTRSATKSSSSPKTTAAPKSTCSRECPNGNASASCLAGKSCGCSCSSDGNAVCSCK